MIRVQATGTLKDGTIHAGTDMQEYDLNSGRHIAYIHSHMHKYRYMNNYLYELHALIEELILLTRILLYLIFSRTKRQISVVL